MASEDPLLVSMTEFARIVSKLKGEANYFTWRVCLRQALEARGEKYWQMLTGEYTKPMPMYLTIPSEDEANAAIAAETYIEASQVTAEQVTAYLDAIQARNDALRAWNETSAAILPLLLSVLDPMSKVYVAAAKDAFHSFRHIQTMFGTRSHQSISRRYQTWVSCTYRMGQSAQEFAYSWHEALYELCQALGPDSAPSPLIQLN